MALTGKKFWFDNLRIEGDPITGIAEYSVNTGFQAKAFPNPFTGITTIDYYLTTSAHVDISIYNVAGIKMTTLKNGQENHGSHQVRWIPDQKTGVQEGIYFCRISTKDKTEVVKLILENQ
jgi:serine protease AprX